MAYPNRTRLYPYRGCLARLSPTFGACLRRGRLIGFVHVCVHVGTINAHHSRAQHPRHGCSVRLDRRSAQMPVEDRLRGSSCILSSPLSSTLG